MTARTKVVKVNERGIRIGESHPNARLTDREVEQLIADRGPESDPRMSLRELAVKWGLSKSGVKKIIDGSTRNQRPARAREVERSTGMQAAGAAKVRAVLHLTVAERARLARLGGSAWVRRVLRKQIRADIADDEMRAHLAAERVQQAVDEARAALSRALTPLRKTKRGAS